MRKILQNSTAFKNSNITYLFSLTYIFSNTLFNVFFLYFSFTEFQCKYKKDQFQHSFQSLTVIYLKQQDYLITLYFILSHFKKVMIYLMPWLSNVRYTYNSVAFTQDAKINMLCKVAYRSFLFFVTG